MPPTSLWDACWWPRRVLYFSVNPLGFHTSFGWAWLTVPAMACFLMGLVSTARRDPRAFGILALPLIFTALASSAHIYPFHGRLVLFLVPSFLLFIGDGAVALSERVGRRLAWAVVLGPILLVPTLRDLYHVETARQRNYFDRHGDRDPYVGIVDSFPFGPW
jgi:hypothetical protein